MSEAVLTCIWRVCLWSLGMECQVTGLIGCKRRGVCGGVRFVVCDSTASAAPDPVAWLSCVISCMKQQLTSSLGWWPHTNTITHTPVLVAMTAGTLRSQGKVLSITHLVSTPPLSQRWSLTTEKQLNKAAVCFFSVKVLVSQLWMWENDKWSSNCSDFTVSHTLLTSALILRNNNT